MYGAVVSCPDAAAAPPPPVDAADAADDGEESRLLLLFPSSAPASMKPSICGRQQKQTRSQQREQGKRPSHFT